MRTALWMVVAISVLMGAGAAAFDSNPLLAFLGWTLVFLVVLGVPAILVAVVGRWLNFPGIDEDRGGAGPGVGAEGPGEPPRANGDPTGRA